MAIDHDMALDAYHKSSRISASKIKAFRSGGPRLYYERYVARTRAAEQSEAMVLGQAFEDALLQTPLYAKRYAVKPDGMNFATKEGKAWKAAHEDRVILRADEHQVIGRMVAHVLEHPVASVMVETASQQVTATSDYEGLPGLATRPDLCDLEGPAVTDWEPYTLDLKTTADMGSFVRQAFTLGYDVQAALARHVLRANGITPCRHYLLAVEKQAPYRVQLFRLSAGTLYVGERSMLEALDGIARCFASGEWPLTPAQVVELDPPAWFVREAC